LDFLDGLRREGNLSTQGSRVDLEHSTYRLDIGVVQYDDIYNEMNLFNLQQKMYRYYYDALDSHLTESKWLPY